MPLERCHELAPVVREASAEIGRRLTGARDAWSRATRERSMR
jgi:hypothetical protein